MRLVEHRFSLRYVPLTTPTALAFPRCAGLGSPGSVWTHLTDISTLGGAFKGVSAAGGHSNGATRVIARLALA